MQGSVGEDEGENASAGDALLNVPEIAPDSGIPTGGRGFRAAMRPGTAGSALIHVLAALFLLYGFTAPEPAPASVPVDLVVLEPETTSPLQIVPHEQKAALPRKERAGPSRGAAAAAENRTREPCSARGPKAHAHPFPLR